MLTQSLFSLLLLAAPAVLAEPHWTDTPSKVRVARAHNNVLGARAHQRASTRRVKRASAPDNLATGSLTAAEGCTDYYYVPQGTWCIQVADKFGIKLEDLYAWNPSIDAGKCLELWAGYSYCVGKSTSSADNSPSSGSGKKAQLVASQAASPTTTPAASSSAAPSHTAASIDAKKQNVQVTSAAPQTTAKATPTTTTAAPAPTKNDTKTESDDDDEDCDAEDDDDDDEDCDDDDEDESSSSAAPQPTTSKSYQASQTAALAAKQATTTTAAPAATSKVANPSGGSLSNLVAAGISSSWTSGTNGNAIFSWFHTNSGQDSTNGHSWCYNAYDDSMPGIAISLKTMLSTFNGDAIAAGKAYCGLEVLLTTPNGKTATAYVIDAFDDTWVRTPNSADVVFDLFAQLWGSDPTSKNDVFTGASWVFTGGKNSAYAFNGGNPV